MASIPDPQFITSASDPDDENLTRTLCRRALGGELTRIRAGLYLPSQVWNAQPPWERYRIRIHAVQRTSRNPPVFSHRAAAQLWGLPIIEVPDVVDTLVQRGGGGRSSLGVRRHPGDLAHIDVVELDGILVTGKVQTARDLAATLPFAHALAVLDALLSPSALPGEHSPQPIGRADVEESIALLTAACRRRRALRVLDAADPASGSAGESVSRGHLLQLGFPRPALQYEIRDSQGFVARTDFYWKDAGLVGEFGGWAKYSRGVYLQGRLPEDVLAAEKVREDRIRALGLKVTRWMWPTAKNPALLGEQLLRAGLQPVRK